MESYVSRRGPGMHDPKRPRAPRSGRSGRGLTGLIGILILVGVAAVGALIGGLVDGGPGLVLDISLVAGAVLAAGLTESRLAWVVIPMPPLVFAVMAMAAGVIGDQNATSSTTRLATAAGTWVIKGFVAMTAATLLAAAIAIVRMTAVRRR